MFWGRAAIVLEALFFGTLLAADIGAGLPLRETVSELVYHPTGPLAVAAFTIHAVSLACLGMALGGWARGGAWTAAIGMVLVIVFWTDSGVTWEGRIHSLGAVLAFGGVAVAAWVRRIEQPLVPLSLLVVVNTVVLAGVANDGGLPLGIVERLQVFLNAAWLLVAAGWAGTPQAPAAPATAS